MDFIHRLREHVDFKTYGPREYGRVSKEVCPYPYNRDWDMEKIYSVMKPDVILGYSKATLRRWLPGNLIRLPIPRVLIEVDFWYERGKRPGFYHRRMWDLVVQRGYYNMQRPSVWLPFSAHEEFLKFQGVQKKKRIGFVGQHRIGINHTPYYKFRSKALLRLQNAGVIKNHGLVGHKKYPETIGQYKYLFTDAGGIKHQPIAKIFEYMAVGGLVLTNKFLGWEALFGKPKPFVEYRDDLSNLRSTADRVLAGRCDNLINRSKEVIKRQHLHKHRIKELVDILYAMKNNKIVPKKWGH
jgi:hypothetical protein